MGGVVRPIGGKRPLGAANSLIHKKTGLFFYFQYLYLLLFFLQSIKDVIIIQKSVYIFGVGKSNYILYHIR